MRRRQQKQKGIRLNPLKQQQIYQQLETQIEDMYSANTIGQIEQKKEKKQDKNIKTSVQEQNRKRSQQISLIQYEKQTQLLKKEQKLKQMKRHIQNRQRRERREKNIVIRKKSKEASENCINWRDNVSKNHQEYISALQNSIKLMQNWENKDGDAKAMKILNTIPANKRMKKYESYVDLSDSSSMNPEIEEKVYENSSRYRQKSSSQMKSRAFSRIHSQISSRDALEKSLIIDESSAKPKNKKVSVPYKGSSISRSRSLCKNQLEKPFQPDFNQAKNIKRYLNRQKSKMNHQRSQERLQKFERNKKKLEEGKIKKKKEEVVIELSEKKDISLPMIKNGEKKKQLQALNRYISSYVINSPVEKSKKLYNNGNVFKLRNMSPILKYKNYPIIPSNFHDPIY